MDFVYPAGTTPLDSDEVNGLIPKYIETHAELNEWEQANILEAERWLKQQRSTTSDILDIQFIKRLHKRMFSKTWRWAGQFRRSNKNIGIHWPLIPEHLKLLLDDVVYQLSHHTYEINEIVARFHYRLAFIHPFSNGNGRHARLMTDGFLVSLKRPIFTWGQKSGEDLYRTTKVRKEYIEALQEADKNNFKKLLQFVRS